jgi:DNA adenine methylase
LRYFGGKSRLGKDIAHFLMVNHPTIKNYWEPFCGMCSVMEHISILNRRASDIQTDLILLLQALKEGWLPPTEISEELYNELKNVPPSALRGFAGFGCSNSGKWFGGYARDKTKRNYALNAHNSLLKKIKNLNEVQFVNESYNTFDPTNFLIYCDPPYSDTTSFSTGEFNHTQFWEWVRKISLKNTVYTSEYTAPDDFEIAWQKSVQTDMKNANKKRIDRIEKLFKLKQS